MNKHSQMSEGEIKQIRQKIDEIEKIMYEVITAYEKEGKVKDIYKAVEKICKIINSIPSAILDDKLKKRCCNEFKKAKNEPSYFSIVIEKLLAVICFVLNQEENAKIIRNASSYIKLKRIIKSKNETIFAIHKRRPKTVIDSVLNELGNIKFGAY